MADLPRTVDLERLRDALDVAELVETAQALVRAPSENPPGDEKAVAAVVAQLLRNAGASDVTTVVAEARRHSVIARWGAPRGRVLAWNGHLDVVPVGDREGCPHPPYDGVVSEGRLWGRGAADMKGPIACALQAVRMLDRAGLEPRGEVAFSLVADEEAGGESGAAYLLGQGLLPKADAGVCGEPTNLEVMTGARGRLWFDVTTFGRSAHASQPERGENAITAMLEIADALAEADPRASPTLIAGGAGPNTIPDRCSLTIDRRFSADEGAEAVRARIVGAVGKVRARSRMQVELVERACLDAAEISPDAEIVHVTCAAAESVTGRPTRTGRMRAATDARFLIAAGIPTVVFGPGDLAEAHTPGESIAVAELVQGALAYAAVMCRFLEAT
ncbi:MAG TPA: M20 family metallopeptidase [Gaiellaceae bacterium]|jgi:acetylornithine deacetylase/succinyl-diaminopimelate desuccinylase family protein